MCLWWLTTVCTWDKVLTCLSYPIQLWPCTNYRVWSKYLFKSKIYLELSSRYQTLREKIGETRILSLDQKDENEFNIRLLLNKVVMNDLWRSSDRQFSTMSRTEKEREAFQNFLCRPKDSLCLTQTSLPPHSVGQTSHKASLDWKQGQIHSISWRREELRSTLLGVCIRIGEQFLPVLPIFYDK